MRRKFLLWLLVMLGGLVAVVQAQNNEPRPLYALPSATTPVFRSSSLAMSDDGRTLVAANMLNDTISIIDPTARAVRVELPAGDDPRSIALTVDNTRALVVNRADGTLSVFTLADQTLVATYPLGVLPYAVITNNDTSAYVSLQGSNEILHLDVTTGEVINRLAVGAFPAGLAIWGDFLYVTHFWSGDVTLIYLPQMEVVRQVQAGTDTSLSQSLTIDPTNGLLYLPQTRSNAQNDALTFDTVVFPVVNVFDLNDLGAERVRRVALDVADRPVNMPFDASLDTRQNRLFVVNAGSDNVSVIDLNTGLSLANVRVGANPRSIRLNRDFGLLYVHNMIDGSLTIIDTRTYAVTDVLSISDLVVSASEFFGAQLFHNSSNAGLSEDGWISCASCHFDGLSDGRVWLERNTPVLFGLEDTAPYTWVGAWDELADVELKIRALQSGRGLIDGRVNAPLADPHAGLSTDLDDLTTYLAMLPAPVAPITNSETVDRGGEVFTAQNCAACHSGEAFTDGLRHDVGTGGEFDTPTLNWLWLSEPYLHDGRAATLADVFALPGAHQLIGTVPMEDIQALIAYLRSLPTD
ncbi:MAG: hypothetical protein OHK0046_48840 [Anaerolineae bacterium]